MIFVRVFNNQNAIIFFVFVSKRHTFALVKCKQQVVDAQ